MQLAVEMPLGGIIYVPNLLTIGLDIQAILRLLPQLFERFKYWYD
jgi:hypothetical protein